MRIAGSLFGEKLRAFSHGKPNSAQAWADMPDAAPVEEKGYDRKRPGIPPLLICAACLWAASALCYMLLFGAEAAFARKASVAFVVIAAALAVAFAATKANKAVMCVLFIAIGGAIGAGCSYSYDITSASIPDDAKEREIKLTSDPKASEFGLSAEGETAFPGGRNGFVKVYLPEGTVLYSGAVIRANFALKAVSEDDAERSYFSSTAAKATIEKFEQVPLALPLQAIYDLRADAIDKIEAYGGNQAGILEALVCGYRPTLSETGEYELFKRCGLAHIVAVSGAHLAIVTMVFGCILRMLNAPRKLTLLASTAFVFAYLAFSGMPISAMRAAAMVLLSLFSGIAKRRSMSLNSLAVCIIAFIATDPRTCISVSFFLSAASTLGIVMFTPLAESLFKAAPSVVQKTVGAPLSMTLASNVMTLPFSAALFGMVPLISPVANIVATPLFTVACVAGLACTLAACLVPQIAFASICAASLLAAPLQIAVEALSSVPGATMEATLPVVPMVALSLVLAVVLWAVWPNISLKASKRTCLLMAPVAVICAAIVAFPAIAGPTDGDYIVMLDVGQGDAIVVMSEGHALLVDTGNQDAKLAAGLSALGIRHLDAVAITHPDDDHCGSICALQTACEVDAALCAKGMLECTCTKCKAAASDAAKVAGEEDVIGLRCGDVINIGNFTLEVLWPIDYADEGGNADSLCLLARIDCDDDGTPDYSSLLTGDAEAPSLKKMLSSGAVSDIDVLKVGHHGSKASLDEATATALDPEIALVSVGANNRYGHPSEEAIGALSETGADIYRTDEDGTVRIRFEKSGIEVKTG